MTQDEAAGDSLQEDRMAQGEPLDEALEAWIAEQPSVLAPIIRRWGRELFEFCRDTGGLGGGLQEARSIYSEAFQVIAGAPSKRGIAQALDQRAARVLAVLEGIANRLAGQVAAAKAWRLEDIRECQEDIARAAQLLQAAPGRGPSGLILPPH